MVAIICTGGEYDGQIGVHVVDTNTGEIIDQNYANLANDLPEVGHGKMIEKVLSLKKL